MTWFDVGPCTETSTWLRAFNAVMNVVQVVACAYIANRAYRKNREDAERRYNKSIDD